MATWVCTQCNEISAKPRGIFNWRCPRGHLMFDGHLPGRTFATSYLSGVLDGFAAMFLLFVVLVLGTNLSEKIFSALNLALFAVIIPLFAVLSYLRGRRWKKEGGAVAKLADHAFGLSMGYVFFWLCEATLFAAHGMHLLNWRQA